LYSLARAATGNSYLCCLVLAVNTRTDAITTCCQRLISAATQPSSILLKSVAIGFHQTLKINNPAYL